MNFTFTSSLQKQLDEFVKAAQKATCECDHLMTSHAYNEFMCYYCDCQEWKQTKKY